MISRLAGRSVCLDPRWAILLALLLLAAISLPARPATTTASSSVFLEELTWTELRSAIASGKPTILIPIGSTEQSWPSIELGKHDVRVKVLSGMIAQKLGDAIVAPVIAYVPEGSVSPPTSHMRFPGTIASLRANAVGVEGDLRRASAELGQLGVQEIVNTSVAAIRKYALQP